ncbi:MAG: SPOR domain-containing protein [Gammaproteobacteria bacterium]
MDRQLKQRVVGAAVLVLLGVVFIPLFLGQDPGDTASPSMTELPPRPSEPYGSRVEPLDDAAIAALERAAETPLEAPARSHEERVGEAPEPVSPQVETAAPDGASEPATDVTAAAAGADTTSVGNADDVTEVAQDHAGNEAAAPPAGAGWTVQLGSFAEQENATRLVARLQKARLPGYLRRVEDAGTSIWKVRVGPLVARDEAEDLRARLAREFGLEGLLLRYP